MQKKISELSRSSPVQSISPLAQLPIVQEKFILLTNLDDIAGKKPFYFRLPNGDIIKLSTWKDILRESCKFSLAHNSSIQIPFPDRVGKKVAPFTLEKPAKKVSFVTEQYNGQKIYIYLNYDSHDCVANALYVLDQTPKEFRKVSPAAVLKD